MPGPAPKNPATRQRRNQKSARAVLPAEIAPIQRTPALPAEREWHTLTTRWWRDIWKSPMAEEFIRADVHALFRLAILVDMFWTQPSLKLASEIRLQQQAFGLTPLDRTRLEWSIEQTEQARERGERQRIKRAVVISGDDPREILK